MTPSPLCVRLENVGEGWLADVGADPRSRARAIGRAHDAFLAASGRPGAQPEVRSVVSDSWRRSVRARVDPDVDPPVLIADDDLAAYRSAHPLAVVMDVLRELVGAAADDARHLMAVSDAAGRLLWVEGHAGARRRAEAMNFVEGAVWDESHAGTNAPGTALAVGHEVQIFATEHFRHTVQGWTCAAAPIHDPSTGVPLGVVDVTGGDTIAHPHSLALVKAAARAAEGALAFRRASGSGLWVPPERPADRLTVLGVGEPTLRLDGRVLHLGRRNADVLFLLATHPGGMTGDQLTDALYAGFASDGGVRVEVNRLRQLVGDLVLSRPYRLARPLESDFAEVSAALRHGSVAAAVNAYKGPLLPGSDAPAVVVQRDWLEAQIRSAVLADGDVALLHSWAERFAFDDLQVWERLAALAAGPVAAIARARVLRLRADYGLPPGVTEV